MKESRITVSFYKYFYNINCLAFCDKLYTTLTKLKVFGRIYVAKEGINAQISVPKNNLNLMQDIINDMHPALNSLKFNFALDNNRQSFKKLCIKNKKHIVSDGIQDINFNMKQVGQYINAQEVNLMLDDINILFVDIRNSYEYEIGHFRTAISIPSNTFREQLSMLLEKLKYAKEKKIVLYCTGGIRCEKATAWMLYHGFKYIYHIKGGIINYVHQAKKQKLPIKFLGKNFVFDARLNEQISYDVIACCYQCGIPYDNHTNCLNQICHKLFIQCPKCMSKYDGCCGVTCQKEKNNLLSNNNIN